MFELIVVSQETGRIEALLNGKPYERDRVHVVMQLKGNLADLGSQGRPEYVAFYCSMDEAHLYPVGARFHLLRYNADETLPFEGKDRG